jgi:hypothetical protein
MTALLAARAGEPPTRTAAPAVSVTAVPRIAIVKPTSQDAIGGAGHHHMGDASVENLARLKEAGINTIAFWTGYYPRVSKSPEWWNDPATMEIFAEASRRAKKLGMSVFYVTYLGGGVQTFPTIDLQISRDFEGKGEKGPSWFDPDFWHKAIIPRDRAFAKLVREGLGDGILMEPEYYAKEGALMERGQIDFGDVAYTRFAQSVGLNLNLPNVEDSGVAKFKGKITGPGVGIPKPEDRAREMMANGMIGPYVEWQAAELNRFAAEWKNALRSEAPNVQLGFYEPGAWHSLWLKALAQGMNDPDRPMLILDGSTYFGYGKNWFLKWEMHSMPDYATYVHEILKKWQISAHVAFGLSPYQPNFKDNPVWKESFDRDHVVNFLRETVELGCGWWIWNQTADVATILEDIRKSEVKEE